MAETNEKRIGQIKLLLYVLVILISGISAFIVLREKVNTNSKDISQNVDSIKNLAKIQLASREELIEMKGDLKTIRVEQRIIGDGITEIKEKLK